MSFTTTKTRPQSLTRALSIRLAGASLLTLAALSATPAHALNIVTGSITGNWNTDSQNTDPLGAFTITYSYDSDATTPFNNLSGTVTETGFTAVLRSLSVSSPSFNQSFDLTTLGSNAGGGQVRFTDYSDSGFPINYQFGLISAGFFDSNGLFNALNANRKLGVEFGPVDSTFVSFSQFQGNKPLFEGVSRAGAIFDPEFPTTAIPTPALVPGLVAWSVAMLRKRRDEAVEEGTEA